ncbi:hypothetical protein ACI2T0_13485 [Ralstonia nicotianae]
MPTLISVLRSSAPSTSVFGATTVPTDTPVSPFCPPADTTALTSWLSETCAAINCCTVPTFSAAIRSDTRIVVFASPW